MSDVEAAAGHWRSRSSRRLLLQAAAAATGSFALAGCRSKPAGTNGTSQQGQSASAAAPLRGGTLTIATNFRLGFDPHVMPTTEVSIEGMFYSTLIRANPKTNELEPDLAAKWEASRTSSTVCNGCRRLTRASSTSRTPPVSRRCRPLTTTR